MTKKERVKKWKEYYSIAYNEHKDAERLYNLYKTEENRKALKKAETKKKVYWLIYRDMYDKAYRIG